MLLKITSIASILLFILWFIYDPSYEPVIGFILTTTSLIGIIKKEKTDWRLSNKILYTLNVRGFTINQTKEFFEDVMNKYFEITAYRIEEHGEWHDIVFQSQTKINLENFYNDCYDISKVGIKIYHVEGNGEYFGLDGTDAGPARYEKR